MIKTFNNIFKTLAEYKRLSNKTRNQRPIILYSQSRNDLLYFGTIPKNLKSKKIEYIYVTSDFEDPYYLRNKDHSFYLGNGLILILFFITNKASLFLTTQPGLDTTYFRRSLNDVHYCYIFHSLISTHIAYRQKAFDHFDSILLGGEHHFKELQQHGFSENGSDKTMIKAGYPRLDTLAKKERTNQGVTPHSILLAPTWGSTSISNTCLELVVTKLLELKIDLVYRPHPMTVKNDRHLIKGIESLFANHEHFSVNTDIGQDQFLLESKVLVTDWSGVAFDFSLGLLRPSVFINLPIKNNSPFSNEQKLASAEYQCREEFGALINLESIDTLNQKVMELIRSGPIHAEKLKDLRSKYTYNFGHSEEIATSHIYETALNKKTSQ